MNIARYLGQKGIQRKLIVSFLLTGLIPMIIVGSIFYYNSSRALINNANSAMTNVTAKAIELLDSQFTIYKMQVEGIVAPCKQAIDMLQVGMDIDVGNRENIQKTFDEIVKANPALRGIYIIDAKGDEKVSSRAQGGRNVASLPWFQKLASAKDVTFSDPYLSKEIGEPVITMGKGFPGQDGKMIALLAIDIAVEAAVKPISNIRIGKGGFAYILNKEGLVVSYPDKAKILQLNLATYDFGKEILQKKTGILEYSWEGNARYVSFQEYPAMGWIIVSLSPKGEILESANTMKLLFIGLLIVMAFFSLIAGVIFALRLVKPIDRVVTGITDAANQVGSAALQVSESSQRLAEGASEQAASLEETSSSLEEMSSMAKQSSDNAGQARAMMTEAKGVVEKANGQMAQLTDAIGEITRSSEETGKIIKTIDEIAFQTNLLALNAAVEAARAGEAGAGFAVVADEVRNLALRAAEAAKNTSSLIEKTIKAVKNGNEITVATQSAFRANAEISGKIGQLVDEIATASEEQANGIGQVSKAVSEMDRVTQQTAASAEESASASEELNAQAQQMRGYIDELAAVVGRASAASPARNNGIPALAGPAGPRGKHSSGKGTGKAGEVNSKTLIPFDEDEKREFKDF
ncbi:MAG: methyl-accepting chemotaxis protein [Deltaproteobacteria bacterium]|nr:methyl-accepting chemotaxis protein [Deltaproteobacteria bacterium]